MHVVETEACLNCGNALTGAYCASCGQKKIQTDLTLRELLHETTHELAHWDGKIPATLETLFFQPGVLTEDFLAGRRARWLPPLRLYLICSIAFFLSGPIVESITHRRARETARITITNPDGSSTLTPEGRQEIAQGWPGRVFGVERLERAAADSARLNHAIQSAYPRAMFILLPIFALVTSVMWRRHRYPAHLYLALHLHAAWFGTFAITTLASMLFTSIAAATLIGAAAVVYVIWYTVTTMRRVFGESWPRTLAKSAIVAVVYSVCLFAGSLVMLAYALAMM